MNSQTINKETPAPKVSVLVPVYRPREEYLRACIDSILSQTFCDFELLLLDDCPEDRTAEAVIKSYADGRIRYSRNPANLGISASRNLLIDMARGEYLAVMDHDDISLPERLEKETAYLDARPEVGVVSGRVLKIPQNKASHNPETSHAIKLSLMTVCALTHPAAMIRKSVLQQHHIRYEEEFSPAEDLRCGAGCCRIRSFITCPISCCITVGTRAIPLLCKIRRCTMRRTLSALWCRQKTRHCTANLKNGRAIPEPGGCLVLSLCCALSAMLAEPKSSSLPACRWSVTAQPSS